MARGDKPAPVEVVKVTPEVRQLTGTAYILRQYVPRFKREYTACLKTDGRIDSWMAIGGSHVLPCPYEGLPIRLQNRMITKQREVFRNYGHTSNVDGAHVRT